MSNSYESSADYLAMAAAFQATRKQVVAGSDIETALTTIESPVTRFFAHKWLTLLLEIDYPKTLTEWERMQNSSDAVLRVLGDAEAGARAQARGEEGCGIVMFRPIKPFGATIH